MRIVLTPQAVSDIKGASAYYAGKDQELSAQFVDGVDALIRRIEMFPKGATPVDGFDELRRARMRHFPYGIFYQQTQAGELLVVRLLRARRHHPDALDG